MAQTGDIEFGYSTNTKFDLNKAGTGSSDLPDLKSEFSDLPHEKGTLSMASSSNPNSAKCQFFICIESVLIVVSCMVVDRCIICYGYMVVSFGFVINFIIWDGLK